MTINVSTWKMLLQARGALGGTIKAGDAAHQKLPVMKVRVIVMDQVMGEIMMVMLDARGI